MAANDRQELEELRRLDELERKAGGNVSRESLPVNTTKSVTSGQQDTSSREAFLKSGLPPVKETGIDLPFGLRDIGGVAETAATVGSGLAGSVAGTVASAAKRIGGASPPEAAQTSSDVARSMTYEPRTRAGRSTLESLQGALETSRIAGLGPPEQMLLGGMPRLSAGTIPGANKTPFSAAAPTQAGGRGAQAAIDSLQSVRDKIEGKVAGKKTRAEEMAAGLERNAVESGAQRIKDAETRGAGSVEAAERSLSEAREAPRGMPTATASELGQTVRGVITRRKDEIDEHIKKVTEEARLNAFSTDDRVNLEPALSKLEKMKAATNRPDILAALKDAEKILNGAITKSGVDVSSLSVADIAAMRKSGELVYDRATGNFLPAKGARAATVELTDDARQGLNDILRQVGRGEFAAKEIKLLQNAIEGNAPQKYKDYLKVERTERQKLDPFSLSSGKGARTGGVIMKDQFGRDFMTNPESIGGKFLRAGDEGAAAAREFKTATGGDPEAMSAMSAYIAGKLKDTPPEKWGAFIKKHESALKEYGLYDALRKYEQTAASAEDMLAKATGLSKEELSAAQKASKAGTAAAKESAADVTGRAAQTEKNVRATLSDNALGKITSDIKGGKRLTPQDAQNVIDGIFTSKTPGAYLTEMVKVTKHDPAALQGLREAYTNWLTDIDPKTGNPPSGQLLGHWKNTKEAVVESGLMSKSHAENMDTIMSDVRGALNKRGAKKFYASAAGFFAGHFVGHPIIGSHLAGDLVAKGVNAKTLKALQDAVVKIASDPDGAAALAGPPTPANIERIRVMVPADLAALLAPVAARQPQTTQQSADLVGIGMRQ